MSKLKLNRRGFLKSSLTGVAGVTIGAPALAYQSNPEIAAKKIITRKLGNTGIVVPIVSLGVMRADNPNLVRASLDAGITHLDTAHHYQQGNNEKMLGEVLKDYKRSSYTIATKVLPEDYYINKKYEKIGEKSTREKFLERFDISLKRLQLKHVDILYFHNIKRYEDALFEPILEAMKQLKTKGKILHIGISTHHNEPEVIQAAMDSGIYEVILTSVNFKQSHKKELKEKIDQAAAKGIGIVGMKTMAGAFMDKERTKPLNCKAALKWSLQNPNVHTTIPGMVSFEQLEENMSVMENLELTAGEQAHLEEAGLVAGLYCDGCNTCLKDCKKNLPINDIMRAYMYAYGYNSSAKAYELIKNYDIPENPCASCTSCNVNCKKGFNINERIADVTRLRNIPEDFLA